MKFIFNTILWGLATFMIFAHEFMGVSGKDYFLIIGSTILFLSVLKGYEKGTSVGRSFFSLFLFLVVGSIALTVYKQQQQFIDHLDDVIRDFLNYGVIYLVIGIVAFGVDLLKTVVTKIHYGNAQKISARNQQIYMSNSSAHYQSKEEEDRKVAKILWICDFIIATFVVVSTYALLGLHFLGIKSQVLQFNLDLYANVIICASWIVAMVYYFNLGVKYLIYAIAIHCVGCILTYGVLSKIDGITFMITSIAYFYVPAICLFFIRELKLVTSFKDY